MQGNTGVWVNAYEVRFTGHVSKVHEMCAGTSSVHQRHSVRFYSSSLLILSGENFPPDCLSTCHITWRCGGLN